MITADWVVLGVLALFAILGLLVGFGSGLKFFTSHIFGVIISIVVAYFLFGIVSNWEFVQQLLKDFTTSLENGNNTFCDILLKINIDKICLALVLFLVVQILRIIIVLILRNVFEINNGFVKVINKLLGLVLFVGVAVMLGLIAFQIIAWIGGTTATNFANCLKGSGIKLDEIFVKNPLNSIFSK